ncbi:MAG: glycosyltransferase family 2 protein [Planctomycetota bacterium]
MTMPADPDPPADQTPAGMPARVVAVVPAWNRAADLARLLADLAAIDLPSAGASLAVIVVDNGSDVRLETAEPVAAAAEKLRAGCEVGFLRLETNRGGSGGFNTGLAEALGRSPDFVWLIDSDARIVPRCLAELLHAAADTRAGPIAAVGAAVAEPATGKIFEAGARLSRRSARFEAVRPRTADPYDVDYAAACCLLVSAEALGRSGLMPDLFLYGDDVSLCLRLGEHGRIVAAPRARCRHPRFDRYKTWARYYEARNWVVPAAIARVSADARVRRAWREVVLAAGQMMVGRDDLAHLHLRGLADAARGRTIGRAEADRTRTRRDWPLHSLPKTIDAIGPTIPESAQPIAPVQADAPLTRQWRAAVRKKLESKGLTVIDEPVPGGSPVRIALRGIMRLLLTPPAGIAVVNAKAPPHAWCAARIVIAVSPVGYTVRRLGYLDRIAAVANAVGRGLLATARLALAAPDPPESPGIDAGDIEPAESTPAASTPGRRPSLSIVILTRDRIDKLLHTIEQLELDEVGRDAEIIVVDNGSADGTPATLRERHPRVRVVETQDNLGVEGFNRGAQASTGDALLILDDDAWPAPGTLAGALDRLEREPGLDALMLHRRHPKTNSWEWPFDNDIGDADRWPDMGSGNIVRREAWDAVGGYEAGYFLYRNDTDLALKLLAAGRTAAFARGLHVWHDSPIASRKTPAWIRRSTRNWVWLCKRHGGRGSGIAGIALGWLWAHRLARLSLPGHAAAVRGMIEGVAQRPPALGSGIKPDGRALRRLIALKMRYRG